MGTQARGRRSSAAAMAAVLACALAARGDNPSPSPVVESVWFESNEPVTEPPPTPSPVAGSVWFEQDSRTAKVIPPPTPSPVPASAWFEQDSAGLPPEPPSTPSPVPGSVWFAWEPSPINGPPSTPSPVVGSVWFEMDSTPEVPVQDPPATPSPVVASVWFEASNGAFPNFISSNVTVSPTSITIGDTVSLGASISNIGEPLSSGVALDYGWTLSGGPLLFLGAYSGGLNTNASISVQSPAPVAISFCTESPVPIVFSPNYSKQLPEENLADNNSTSSQTLFVACGSDRPICVGSVCKESDGMSCGSSSDCASTHCSSAGYCCSPQSEATPTLSGLPANIDTFTNSTPTIPITYVSPTAVNQNGVPLAVACSPASGAQFPIGNTTVTCQSVQDDCGASVSGSFTVTVEDHKPPVLQLPQDLPASEADGPSGARVVYNATATNTAGQLLPASCSPASDSIFPIGSTQVRCSATNAYGLSTKGTFEITVEDKSPPQFLTTQSNLIFEAQSALGAIATWPQPIANDIVDGPVSVSCLPPSGTLLPIATTIVTCSATDSHTNTNSFEFLVTVEDSLAPVLDLPGNITAEATGPGGAQVSYAASASDRIDGAVAVSCSPASGATFPLGATPVECLAKDEHGNTSTASFQITVQDTTKPVISGGPGAISGVQATSPAGAIVSWPAPVAVDLVSGTVPVLCTPASGSTFALGLTSGRCTATDRAGNTSYVDFSVEVQATLPPTLNVPSSFTVSTTNPIGAEVSYAVTASDVLDGQLTPSCSPSSGALFSIGATAVDCHVTNSRALTTAASFIVTVTFTDPCADNGGCDPLASCTNVAGSASCGACPLGYGGGGATGCVSHPLPIQTIIGTGASGYNGEGMPGACTELTGPFGSLVYDAQGGLYFIDYDNPRVRRMDGASGLVTTVLGTGNTGYSPDGTPALSASLWNVSGIALDANGTLFFVDGYNQLIRKVDPATHAIVTVAGNGADGSGSPATDGIPATEESLAYPFAIAFDSDGTLYFSDRQHNTVRTVDSAGLIHTVAGNGTNTYSGDQGPALQAGIGEVNALVFDAAGNLYLGVGSEGVGAIRKIAAASGIITTIAGTGVAGFNGDGPAASTLIGWYISGIAVEPASGDVYFGDYVNQRVRRVDASGIHTIAGTGIAGFNGDGPDATLAEVSYPNALVFDPSGNLLFSDYRNFRIRRFGGASAPACPTPVNCVVSWSPFSACSASCGGGTETRTATVTTPPANGGAACPALVDTESCNTQPCDPCAISNGGCAQVCKDQGGTAVCSCTPGSGYLLDSDGVTCSIPPVLTVPSAPIVAPATSCAGGPAAFSVTASEPAPDPSTAAAACTASLNGTIQTVSSNSTIFPIGATTVSCVATNSAGQSSASQQFTVQVQDLPTLGGPSKPIYFAAQAGAGPTLALTPANLQLVASDVCGTPQLQCTVNNGAATVTSYSFPINTAANPSTAVACVAVNSSGGRSPPVTVQIVVDGPPAVALSKLPACIGAASNPLAVSGTAVDLVGLTSVSFSDTVTNPASVTNVFATPSPGQPGTYSAKMQLEEGVNAISFSATNTTGTTASTPAADVVLDTIAPSLTVTSPAASGTDLDASCSPSLTVTGQVSDANLTSLTVDGNAVVPNANGHFSAQITLVYGNQIVTVVATDCAGNSTTVTRSVFYDPTAPALTTNIVDDECLSAAQAGAPPALDASFSVTGYGIEVVSYSFTSSKDTTASLTGSTATFNRDVPLQIGENFIAATATSEVGLSSSVHRTVYYYPTGPTDVTIDAPAPGQVVEGTSILLSGTAGPTTSSVTFSIDSGAGIPASLVQTGSGCGQQDRSLWQATAPLGGVAIGNHTLTMSAKDCAGNVTATTLNGGFTLGAPPTVSFTSPANNSTVPAEAINISAAASGHGSKIVQVVITSASQAYTCRASTAESTLDCTWPDFNLASLCSGQGSNSNCGGKQPQPQTCAATFKATATDSAGLTGSATLSLTIDPSLSAAKHSITAPLNGATVRGSISLITSAADSLFRSVQCTVGSNLLGASTNPAYSTTINTLSLEDGLLSISCTWTETNGDTDTKTVAVIVQNWQLSCGPGTIDLRGCAPGQSLGLSLEGYGAKNPATGPTVGALLVGNPTTPQTTGKLAGDLELLVVSGNTQSSITVPASFVTLAPSADSARPLSLQLAVDDSELIEAIRGVASGSRGCSPSTVSLELLDRTGCAPGADSSCGNVIGEVTVNVVGD